MATSLRLRWQPDLNSGLTRRDRRACDYDAYLPDRLEARDIALTGELAAAVADAEAAVARLNLGTISLASSEALARLLLRAEAVASSRIEGLVVSARCLLRAEMAMALPGRHPDVTAEEVLANIRTVGWAIDAVGPSGTITVDHLLHAHRLLLEGSPHASGAGQLRAVQNWIGGSAYNPCGAAFVPPPPEAVPDLLEDLCRFCNHDALPALVQAALAHAQFETIHPFTDGNGRAGRALVHMVLRRRGLVPHLVPPISLVLATRSDEYVAALTATRYLGEPSLPAARQGLDRWIAFFASATLKAAGDVRRYEDRVRSLQETWRARAGRLRQGSAVELLLTALPGIPILTVATASATLGRSYQATNEAVSRLVDVGILLPLRIGRRSRAFEAAGLFDAFADLERELTSPDDTPMSPPADGPGSPHPGPVRL